MTPYRRVRRIMILLLLALAGWAFSMGNPLKLYGLTVDSAYSRVGIDGKLQR